VSPFPFHPQDGPVAKREGDKLTDEKSGFNRLNRNVDVARPARRRGDARRGQPDRREHRADDRYGPDGTDTVDSPHDDLGYF
jgi:hypothetical protein